MKLIVQDKDGKLSLHQEFDSNFVARVFDGRAHPSESEEEFQFKYKCCETLLKACYKLMQCENEGADHVFEILDMVANYDWHGKE